MTAVESQYSVESDERKWLRELAKKVRDYANLPIMAERKARWVAHNSGQSGRPLIVMEMFSFAGDLMPPPRCRSPFARQIEGQLTGAIVNHELIDDDKVMPACLEIPWRISVEEFGVTIQTTHAEDGQGRSLGFSQSHPLEDLERDFEKLKPASYAVDREGTLQQKVRAEELIGDILPVRVENYSLRWHATPSQKVVMLMGMENMLMAMMDCPDAMHRLYQFLVDDILAFVRWQEAEGLLTLNNGNHYAGSGSYGFTDELPTPDFNGRVRPCDLWINMNSQETVGISPAMFGEFIAPYYHQLAEPFGLTYYGCCEPVHDIWDECIRHLPHLRKVSISAWCDERFMGERLAESGIIYSRKPSPNFLAVGGLDEEAYARHIETTLVSAKGCALEMIFRDIYGLEGDTAKPRRAVTIARDLIDRIW